jgi:hypothetical protein
MIGFMSWIGYASLMLFLLVPRIIEATGRILYPISILPFPWLRLFLGGQSDGSWSFPAGVLACWIFAAILIAGATRFSVWGAQLGLNGVSASDRLASRLTVRAPPPSARSSSTARNSLVRPRSQRHRPDHPHPTHRRQLLTGILLAIAGPENIAIAQAIAYAIWSVAVSLGVISFLGKRNVSLRDVIRWRSPANQISVQQLPPALMLAAAGGITLGLGAHGYLAALKHIPATAEILRKSQEAMARLYGLRISYAIIRALRRRVSLPRPSLPRFGPRVGRLARRHRQRCLLRGLSPGDVVATCLSPRRVQRSDLQEIWPSPRFSSTWSTTRWS